jgi:hypothetical protein
MGDGILDLKAAYGRRLPFYHPRGVVAPQAVVSR